jgi:hypothetical protein
MWTRRKILIGGALAVVFPSSQNRASGAHTQGCIISGSDFNRLCPPTDDVALYQRGDEPMIFKSGDENFDFALAQSLAMISEAFDVLPGFAFYDDSGGRNAYATPLTRLTGVDGTVLFGKGLLKKLMASHEYPEVAVAGVCSHEYGHIVQYKNGLMGRVNIGGTHKRMELQADYFAGYFAGIRKLKKSTYPAAVVAMTQHDFGDTDFGNQDHHGTPDERGDAVARGFTAAFNQRRSLREAIEDSTSYVLSL